MIVILSISKINLKHILILKIKSETIDPEGAIVILIFSKETPDLKDYGYFDEFDEEKFKNYEQNE